MFGLDAAPAYRRERELVEDGVLEVDAPPADQPRWRRGELEGDLEELHGHRSAVCVCIL